MAEVKKPRLGGCPSCQGMNVERGEQAGLYVCGDCNDSLLRLKRKGQFGDQIYYVSRTRPGLEKCEGGRHHTESKPHVIETE